MFKAHISGERIQSCSEHSNNTAVYTSENLTKVNLQKLGYLCGLIHDAGKYSDEFNSYIESASRGENVIKGSVIHSFAGVRLVLERYHSFYNGKTNKGWSDLTAEIIATAVGSHHGLFDEYDEDGN